MRAAFGLALLLSACVEEAPVTLPPPPPPLERVPLGTVPDSHPAIDELAVRSRGPRRMSVEQLERSLERIGGLERGAVAFPESLAVTLGKPDYLRRTEESLEPSPLFMKFMLDLGGIICRGLAEAEASRPVAERVFMRADDLDRNLDAVILHFTGIEGDTEYRERLKRTYSAASGGARGVVGGWEAVCIALIASPEFLLY